MKELEIWPGHSLAKKIEVEILQKDFLFNKEYIGLEVGCGDGFESTLLGELSGSIVASDLFSKDNHVGSVTFDMAKHNIMSSQSKNIKLIRCSACQISFKENSFDFIFSSSSLEHIKERGLALREMRRVLKPEGHLIIVLPTHMPCLYAYVHTFLYPIARLLQLFVKNENHIPTFKGESGADSISLWKRFWANHPSFPLPEMHGSYKNIFEEFIQQRPLHWHRLIEANGFKIIKSFSVCSIPWLLIEPFSTKVAAEIYSLSKNFHIRYGHNRFVKSLSYLIGFIARKA